MKQLIKNITFWNAVAWGATMAILFALVLGGFSPYIVSWDEGTIGVTFSATEQGEIALAPVAGREAALAGVVDGDILLAVNQVPLPGGISLDEAGKLVRGPVGEAVTITIRKAGGAEQVLSIVRSQQYLNRLAASGLQFEWIKYYDIFMSLLFPLIFLGLSDWLFWRRPQDKMVLLVALAILIMPFSLNLSFIAYYGAATLGMGWLYSLLRAIGLLSIALCLFLFPNGKFVPAWGRWAAIGVGIWMLPFYAALLKPGLLPSFVLDWAWVLIFVIGVIAQVFRFRAPETTSEEKATQRKILAAGVVALAVYVVLWLLGTFLPASFFNGPGGMWFALASELAWRGAAVYFGFRLAAFYPHFVK